MEILRNEIEEIETLMKIGQYSSAIIKSCSVFEVILKKVYGQALTTLPFEIRTELNKTEQEIGMGKIGYTEFGFGQLVGLFRKCDLISKWAKSTNKDLGLIRSISLNPIVDLRNDIAHNKERSIKKNDAELVYVCLKNWLAFLGYSSIDKSVQDAFKSEPICEIEEANKQYHNHIVKKKIESSYTFSKKSEQIRLGKAVDEYRTIDMRAIDLVMQNFDPESKLHVIDVGCANGKVTESRFSNDNFVSVIGVDYNEDIIAANNQRESGKFQYFCIDLDSDDLEYQLDELMERLNIDKFDIVFSSLVIHHLKHPERVLRCFSKRIRKGGAIILRGAEDGNKVAYDDDGLVEEIIKRSSQVKGMSDRFHGRKFYTQLYRSGFRKIKLIYEERDTVGKEFDERLDMFQMSFAYRKDYFERQLKTDPTNRKYQNELEWICESLDRLEELFVMPDFYYMEIVPVAIGIK